MQCVLCFIKGDNVKNKLDSLFFTWQFVPERHKFALMADANLKFASAPSRATLRNGDNKNAGERI